ncbi:MAG: hypothetical protein WAL61_03335, partial [Acidimicrobiales bacterium]
MTTTSYAWYRLRSTWSSEVSSLVAIVLLVGALGGLSMGAVAAARSTESSFADYVTSTHVPGLFVLDGVINPAIGLDSAYNPALLRKLSRLPHVERVESTVELNMGPLTPQGHPVLATSGIPAEASVGGLDYTEDRLAVVQGRLPNPHRAGEFAVDEATAKMFDYHLGQEIPVGWATNTEITSGNTTSNYTFPEDQRVRAKLVGIVGDQATTLFRDQDDANGSEIMLFSPALTDKLLACCSNDMLTALTLQDGDRYLTQTESAVRQVLPQGLPFVYVQLASLETTANETLRPEAIALAVFGGITGIAALLVAGQVVSRRIRLRGADLDIVRALGGNRSMILADDLVGTLGAVLVGSVLAGLVALGLSPLAPLGPVRPFLGASVHADWTVIGAGVAGLLVALTVIAVVAALVSLPGRARTRAPRVAPA